MERPRLYPIRNRLLAVEVAGIAVFSLSAWAGGAVGLCTGAIVGATVGAPAAVLSEPALDTPSGKVLKTQSTIGAGSESDRIATAPG